MRNRRDNLTAHAQDLINDEAFQQVIADMKAEALRHIESDKLKAYGQDNLSRDRAILEYQIVCDFERRFSNYANRKTQE